MQDSADYARQAVARWRGYADERMTVRTLTEGSIKGILRASIQCLVNMAETTHGEWIWWETTEHSFDFYKGCIEGMIAKANVLSSTLPPVEDVFLVRVAELRGLLKQS